MHICLYMSMTVPIINKLLTVNDVKCKLGNNVKYFLPLS